MKTYRLPYLAVLLLLFLASCDFESDFDEYDDAPPATVTISGLPAPVFSPGAALYIGIMRDERWSISDDGYYKEQGHAPIGADGRVETRLYSPTGEPFKVLGFGGEATVFIMEDDKKTRVI
ncbi:MAG: hypothetical protein LBD58_12375 [Treponema sp.]|jgi:hypothetical protein|nr:hypothetical protein [Treponema sp.]